MHIDECVICHASRTLEVHTPRAMLKTVGLKPLKFQLRGCRGYSQDFRIKRVLRIPKRHMYAAVGDVGRYKEFVPYCVDSQVISSDGEITKALLKVGWNQLEEQFESSVTYSEDHVVATAANNKMFEELQCEWTIREIQPDQCMAALKLRFKFHNKLYDFMAQGAGNVVSKKMIEAFSKRGTEISRSDEEYNNPK